MKVAVVGAGKVGTALGEALASQGHGVTYGVPDPGKDKYAGLAGRIGNVAHAVAGAEVIILATPWPATEAACTAMGDVGGATLIDATNPLSYTPETGLVLLLGFSESGGEKVAAWCPSARVVKAFNATSFTNMTGQVPYGATPPVLFAAGDDVGSKAVVRGIGESLGFEFQDAGPLSHARLLEPLARLSVHVQLTSGLGTGFAVGLVKPAA